ncbi:hypothetical protein AGRA3207_004815 [Actinomadura graeca]|uniref:Uncharacterized protein n=1 Tax=Actinomadura graeca TaxID=2750812 RepID=A0ABX8R3P4_9ACTN|nr:hypothetical protein [Actinomadura graeca]QXJ23633.1 hypothetical protein AGRA3207_004815 [Actinomadura graeca]
MALRRDRTDAYADFLRIAHEDTRLLHLALLRFSQGVPGGDEARKMIDEASAVVVASKGARARVQIVGSDEAGRAARAVSRAAVQISRRLGGFYFSGLPVDVGEGRAFVAVCRRELEEAGSAGRVRRRW